MRRASPGWEATRFGGQWPRPLATHSSTQPGMKGGGGAVWSLMWKYCISVRTLRYPHSLGGEAWRAGKATAGALWGNAVSKEEGGRRVEWKDAQGVRRHLAGARVPAGGCQVWWASTPVGVEAASVT